MFARWRRAGLIVPTLMTLALLPVLIGLGTWQWQRKIWKEELIATIEQRRSAEPVSYAEALARAASPEAVTYLHVTVTGAFDHGEERHVYAPRSQGPGWNVYTLFRPVDGLPPLFVNRGWVPERLKDPASRSEGQVTPPVTVVGLARLPEVKGTFTPDNDLKGNRWYSRDSDAMRWGAAGPPTSEQLATMRLEAYAPFSIDADAKPENPGGWPKGGTTEIRLSNSHLQYVVTWYGLALTLVGVFVVFARQRLAALEDRPPQS
ncbi:MAG: SURF1 family protein [Hyphomicrobium sp.]|nr:SURF1 family protein [Hyphomicrobium sp.]